MDNRKTNFIVIGPNYYNYSFSTVRCLRNMGYSVNFFEEKAFYENCSYFKRKLYKLGIDALKERWNKEWNQELINFIRLNATTKTKLIFLSGGVITSNTLLQLQDYDKVLILWDSIKRATVDFLERLRLYNKVYFFEYDDLDYIKKHFNIINATYLPVGYDENIYFPRSSLLDISNKDIDISFVGAVTAERFHLLEKVAYYANQTGKKLIIYGKWFNDRWPWMTWKFKKNHPDLFSCLNNYNIPPEKTADVYRRSKIVLNINKSIHKSISPRTFEILATNSFQLMNSGQESNNTLNLMKDLVLFKTEDDLIAKINYYLSHENERKEIAQNGFIDCQHFSLSNILSKVLADFEDIK